MPRSLTHRAVAGVTGHVPGLRHIPVFKLLVIAELALLARDHVSQLEPQERRRLLELVRKGKGRTRTLGDHERDELFRIVAKAEPRRFAGTAVNRLSPVPLPRRLVEGPPRPRRRESALKS